MYEPDEQYSQQIARLFPCLRNYTLHLHNDHNLDEREDLKKSSWSFPPLETLRILNARCESSGLSGNIRPTFLVPSVNTLRHLEVQTTSNIPLVDELFGELKFPALETLIIDGPRLSSPPLDFFDRFPNLVSITLPIAVIALLGGKNNPALPKSLQHIAFTRVTNSKVEATTNFLKYGLHTGALQGLRYYVLEGAITPDPEQASEASDAPSILGDLIKVCEKEGIELLYEGAIDDGSIEFHDMPGEPLSEDDEFDFEAEEGEEFRNRWSKEKMRDHEISASSLLCLQSSSDRTY